MEIYGNSVRVIWFKNVIGSWGSGMRLSKVYLDSVCHRKIFPSHYRKLDSLTKFSRDNVITWLHGC